MRVVLHVESEGRLRQTLWLRDNQCAEVGRIAWADLVVDDDPEVAEVHFALQCADEACRIRDLSRSGGTFVNGQQVEFAQLADGDTVQAGQTSFRVRIEDDGDFASSRAARPAAASPGSETRPPAPSVNATPPASADPPPPQTEHSPAEASCCGRRAARTGRGPWSPDDEEPLCVLLRVDGAFYADCCVWLRDHQTLQVGRSCQADLPVEHDRSLEPFHFQLVTDWSQCYLHALRSELPVLVNGRSVAGTVRLRDGDQIHAGQSQFAVTIRGGKRHDEAEAVSGPAPKPAAGPPRLLYREATCQSGLLRYSGLDAQTSPLDVAKLLAEGRRLYLVVNFAAARQPVPSCLGIARDLFAGHAQSPRALGRLMLIAPEDPVDVDQTWAQVLGLDAAIAVVSDRDSAEVLRVLQAGSVTFSAPSIAREQLANLPTGFVRPLLAGLTAVITEAGSANWCAFADPEVVASWSDLGFPTAPESGAAI